MRFKLTSVAGLAAGATVVALGTLAAAQPVADPPGSEGRKWGPPEEIGIQLGLHPNGATITQPVIPGNALHVRLWTRPPARLFRVEAQEATRPVTHHEIPPVPGTLPKPDGLGPECEPSFVALRAMASAETIPQADKAERAFESVARRIDCPQLQELSIRVSGQSRARVPMRWQLAAGEQLRLKVDGIGSDGRSFATWNITLTAEAPAIHWSHANEEEWIAATVVRDVLGLLAHASGATAAPQDPLTRTLRRTASGAAVVQVDLALPGGSALSQEIALEPHVFAPSAYQALARAAAERLKVRPASLGSSAAVIERLTVLRADTLAGESERVGAWLTRQPLDPAGNDEAALIHLALALRESAGSFSDIRRSVARATAHLSVARLSAAPASAAGRLADTALLVLVGRQAEVQPRLHASLAATATPAAEKAWTRALLLRTTEDWRLAKPGETLTLIERLQLYRARKASLDGLLALDMFETQEPEPVPDWSWIALARRLTVQEGHMFAGTAFGATLSELAAVVLHKDVTAVQPADVAAAIQPTEESAVVTWSGGKASVQVLDRATWAGFLARHLLATANATDDHLRKGLSAPERADAFAAFAEPYFKDTPWSLALEPFLGMRDQVTRFRPPSCGAFVKWVQRRPDAVPARSWSIFGGTCREGQTGAIPAMRKWFAGLALPGTVLGLRERTETHATPENIATTVHKLQAIAPYDEQAALVALAYGKKQGDPKAIAEAFAARKDYTLSVLKRLVNAEPDPALRRPTLERICQMSADDCGKLADDLADAGEHAEAARIYERVLKEARDRVLASNDMAWLAAYYLETGKPQEAERVGHEVASVGSWEGLDVLGNVLEQTGRLSEAEKVFKTIEARYQDRAPIDLFYLRAQRLKPGGVYEDAARRAMERVFPGGLERATLADFNGPPTHGVTIREDAAGVRRLGLARNDVIVALDGYRTRNYAQYRALRGFTRDKKMALVVWSRSRGGYVAAEGTFVNRRFGSVLWDYAPR
jgi:hypothetical protein